MIKLRQLVKEEVKRQLDEKSKYEYDFTGYDFPNFKKWWTYEPEKIMSYIYWTSRQLPPSNKKIWQKEWKKLAAKLNKKYPAPKSKYTEGTLNTSKKYPEVLEANATKIGHDRFANIKWLVLTTKRWNEKRAMQFQKDGGKHPAGYGFWSFKSVNAGVHFTNEWLSQANAN